MASSSERRLSLLKRIGYNPDIIDIPEIDENIYINEKPDLYVKRIAREKAEKISKKHKNSYIIAADTVIFSGAKIYGKAFNESDAFTILKKLSGRFENGYFVEGKLKLNIGNSTASIDFEGVKYNLRKLARDAIDWSLNFPKLTGKANNLNKLLEKRIQQEEVSNEEKKQNC